MSPYLLLSFVTFRLILSVVRLSRALSHNFFTVISDAGVFTGSGFLYPTVCSPSLFLVSVYVNVASLFVFNV